MAREVAPSLDDEAAIDRELIRKGGLAEFVRLAWAIVEPTTAPVWSWHMDAVCEDLEAVTKREIRDEVINIPPGCSKSLLVSVLWPAWVWASDPGHRFIATSHNDNVVKRDAEKMRTLVKSDWYRERWPGTRIPEGRGTSDAVYIFRTDAGGMRLSTTVRGKLTGDHADTFIVDDPLDPQSAEAVSGIALDDVIAWWEGKVPTRFRDHKNSARVLIMQRIHERDLAQRMIDDGAHVLCLPMRYEPNHPNASPRDERTEEGELLVPERIPEEELAKLESTLGPTRTAAQMQQRPTPAGGGLFKESYFQKRWRELPTTGTWEQSWDMAFKGTKDTDFVVGQVWLHSGVSHYLVWQVRGRWSFSETCKQMIALSERFPRALRKLIEDKANGPAVADALSSVVQGIELVNPEGGKEARANAVEPLWAGGNVLLPADDARMPDGSEGAPWVEEDFIPEHLSFPRGANDDQVDAQTQALARVAAARSSAWKNAMAKLKGQRV